ncbi:MAG: hypothetical protein JO100_06255 [Pseudonocardia sp.]|nr:hypothetical protein [Pseudonocardia sp.]
MSSSFAQALDDVGKVADAVLFEGYVLYPYRASAQKNQLRWQFGVLTPRDWAQRATENWYSNTECLLEPAPDAVLHVRLRFLRLRRREVQRLDGDQFVDTDELTVGEQLHLPWDEGLPEVIDADLPLGELIELADGKRVIPVELAGERTEEPITEDDRPVGRLVRTSWPVSARITVGTEAVPGPYGALKLRVRVENTGNTGPEPSAGSGREEALRHSLIAAHTILVLSAGEFLSTADPPEWARPAAEACVNEHTWPVLAGSPDHPRVVLSSPIILSDFPEIAPESPNELYDGTENDEILSLRTLALTDAEKREARATDPRAAAVVDAIDSMPPEIFERLHGVIRSMGGVPTFDQVRDNVPTISDETGGKPWWDPGQDASVDPETDSVRIGEHTVAKGTRVILRPTGRADAQDIFLVGRPAVVSAVFNDVDGDVHLAVVLTDDPASEFQASHGRYRYFRPDEIEVLA